MMQKIFLCGAAFVFFSALTTRADEEPDEAKTGFAAAEWTLNQLTRMELNEQGQLQLKRDHWELAAKRPLPKSKQADGFGAGMAAGFGGGRGGFGGGVAPEQPALDKLFNRLADETGGRRGGSSSSGSRGRKISFSSASLKASLNVNEDITEFEIEETADNEQSLRLTEESNVTRLVFRSPSTFVQILRRRDSVHVCSMIDGQVTSWTGNSFAEVVQKHEDYFRNTLQPVLKQVTQLPLDEALEVTVATSDKPVDFQPMQFPAGPLTEGAIGEAFSALARFRLVEGRVRINEFFGDRTILKQEIQKVSAEYQKSLDNAVARLNKLDASDAMINELKNQLNWKRDAELEAINARGFIQGQFGQPQQPDSLLESYNRLKALAHRGGSSSSNNGGRSYSSSFSSGQISASISRTTGSKSLHTEDSAVEFSVNETEGLFELQLESSTGLLVINDRPGRSCSILLVGGGECYFMHGDSFVALVNEHHEKYQERVLPILNLCNISGLDPLGKDAVDAILQRLPTVPEGMLDIETAVGKTDAYVFPLLNDADYLKIIASGLEGDERSAVIARADSLSLAKSQ